MTEMFGEAWPPMSVPDLAPDDDDDDRSIFFFDHVNAIVMTVHSLLTMFFYRFYKEKGITNCLFNTLTLNVN